MPHRVDSFGIVPRPRAGHLRVGGGLKPKPTTRTKPPHPSPPNPPQNSTSPLPPKTGAYLLGVMPPELLGALGIDLPLRRRDPHYFLPTTGDRWGSLGGI